MERQYIISERAHFMCPNMHFGILAEIPSVFSFEKAISSEDVKAQLGMLIKN